MTPNELITPALQAIGVLQETESPSAEQSANALVILNDMMAALSGEGVDLGYAPQSDPTASIDINIEDRMWLKAILAVMLCPAYERPPPAVDVALANEGRNTLLRNAWLRNPVAVRPTLPRGDSQGIGFNILTGR
jgi:hypothetical protein